VALLFKSILPNTEFASRELAMTEYNPSDNDVATQVDRILASRWFSRSERLCRFVRFSTNYALNRGTDRLKEYLVGVEVFDRGPAYDPRIDPIVRVEARRLRAKLKTYYASAGRDDQLRIEFPKGSYSPVFRLRSSRQLRLKPAAHAAIAVSPFENFTNSTSNESFCAGLTEELVHHLAQVPGLQTVVRHGASPGLHYGDDLRRGVTKWNLRGSIREALGTLRIIVQLIETSSGVYLWSDTYTSDSGDLLSNQEAIARAVVTKVRVILETLAPEPFASHSSELSGT
jgi:TolB-like protein